MRENHPKMRIARQSGKGGEHALQRVLGGLQSSGQRFLRRFGATSISHSLAVHYVNNIDIDSPLALAIIGLDGKFGNFGRNRTNALLT
jgi:hypothetical protein